MFRTLLAAVLLPVLASAAPVPKGTSTKKLHEVYGEVVDPDSKCEFKMTKAGGLQVVVPKGQPPVEIDHGKTVPPLIVREIEGDFVLTTRLTLTHDPDSAAAAGAKQVAVAAGVALTSADGQKNDITFVYKIARDQQGKWAGQRFMQHMHRGGGSGSGQGGVAPDGKPVYLRLTRTGSKLKAEHSADGTKWLPFATKTADTLGPAVRIGPVALQSTTADFEAVFDQYEIQPLKAEEKK